MPISASNGLINGYTETFNHFVKRHTSDASLLPPDVPNVAVQCGSPGSYMKSVTYLFADGAGYTDQQNGQREPFEVATQRDRLTNRISYYQVRLDRAMVAFNSLKAALLHETDSNAPNQGFVWGDVQDREFGPHPANMPLLFTMLVRAASLRAA